MHRFSDPLGRFLEGSRLPLRADTVFARIDLKKEIRLPKKCPSAASDNSRFIRW